MSRQGSNHFTNSSAISFSEPVRPTGFSRFTDMGNLSLPISTYTVTDALFYNQALERKFTHTRTGAWATDHTKVEVDELMFRDKRDRSTKVLGMIGNTMVVFDQSEGSIHVVIAGNSELEVSATYVLLKARFPEPPPVIEQIVPVTFWHHSPQGPVPYRRKLDVPTWDEIKTNYEATAVKGMEYMNGWTGPVGGKLMLWWGPPGTGKTYALRSLAWEWREWADLHYLLDPDAMFGGATADLMTIIMNDDGRNRWKLLVLEDTGEMLTADAKRTVGQGLSRLLNLVDGLIGQGLKIMVLVTTNETLGDLHPAVSRPGRAGCQIDFHALGRTQACQWLRDHGVNDTVSGDTMLAELYAIQNDWQQRNGHKPQIGFRSVA